MLYKCSSSLFIEAQKFIPGGVNSPVRSFNAVGGNPVFIKEARGAYLKDFDGNSYIDFINSWGPAILGHAPIEVIEEIKATAEKGLSFGTPTEIETTIAKLVVNSVSNIELIRFVNSGTEACMSAVRLARGYTGKNKIIKFSGCYHGHADAFLVAAGSGGLTFQNPNSPGVPQNTIADTLIAPYNDLEAVKELFNIYSDQIAGVILEPVAGNMGCIVPSEEFIRGLRLYCNDHKALLIFDEVMTGFRLDLGGAQKKLNVDADIVTFGKIIGGGMPVGAFGGKKEIMECLAPKGPVYQAGTLSGNPLAMSAGLKTLSLLKLNPQYYNKIDQTTEELHNEIEAIFKQKSIVAQFNRKGSMFSIHFCENKVTDLESSSKGNNGTFKRFFHHMLKNGIYIPPSAFETWFISTAITNLELEKTLEAINSFTL